MKITLLRRYFAETYTIGTLFVDGERFCDTLEDKARDPAKEAKGKVLNSTPYEVALVAKIKEALKAGERCFIHVIDSRCV